MVFKQTCVLFQMEKASFSSSKVLNGIFLVSYCLPFITSMDIKDVYLHIPIFLNHWRSLIFAVGNNHNQYVPLSLQRCFSPKNI